MFKKYLVIMLSTASMAMCAVGCGKSDNADRGNTSFQESTASTKEDTKEDPKEIVDKSDTFAVADELNANSNTVLKILEKAENNSDKCYYTDGPVCVLAYEGEVSAYAFDYPKNSHISYWTQISVTDSSLNVFGIHTGDDAECIEKVMDQYGYEFVELNNNRKYEYRKGDLHIIFYMDGNDIDKILITVHEDKKNDDIVH